MGYEKSAQACPVALKNPLGRLRFPINCIVLTFLPLPSGAYLNSPSITIMLASIKKVIGKKPPPKKLSAIDEWHRVDDAKRAARKLRDQNRPPPPPPVWPSKWHLPCDIEWCPYPNDPDVIPGNYRCVDPRCPGIVHISEEWAAGTAAWLHKRKVYAELAGLPPSELDHFRHCGQSARVGRKLTAMPPPSTRSAATAPMFVAYPRDPTRRYKEPPSIASRRRPQFPDQVSGAPRPRPRLSSQPMAFHPQQPLTEEN